MLTIGSLFSGVGAMDLGLHWAGHGPVQWQVEIDPWCRQVLEKHWPNTKRYNDIKQIKKGELDPVDIVCGGFPCTDLSRLTQRDGLDGSRSGLWYDMLRIVADVGSEWVVVENVAHAGNRWVDTVRSGLADEGYESLPFTLEASFFGAPHRRARILIVAHSLSQLVRKQSRRRRRKSRKDPSQLAESGAHAGWPSGLEISPQADGAPSQLVRALGNVCMPQMAQVAGEMINVLIERINNDS